MNARRRAAGRAAAERRLDRADAAGDAAGRILSKAAARLATEAGRQVRQAAVRRSGQAMAEGDDLPVPRMRWIDLFNGLFWERALGDLTTLAEEFIIDELDTGYAIAATPETLLVRETLAAHMSVFDGWGDDAREHVQATVRRGFEDGSSVRQVFNTLRTGPLSEEQALTVARTQLVAVSNGASHRANQTISEPGDQREWLATPDSKTRDTHRDADGQQIPAGGQFRVGRALLDYPGDPSGPAGETINCRCTAVLVLG